MSLGQQRGRPYSANESLVEDLLTQYSSLVLKLSRHDNGLSIELRRALHVNGLRGARESKWERYYEAGSL